MHISPHVIGSRCFRKITRQHTARINYRVQGAAAAAATADTASGIVPRATGIEFIAAAYFRQLKGIFIRARANLSRKAFYRLCSIGHSWAVFISLQSLSHPSRHPAIPTKWLSNAKAEHDLDKDRKYERHMRESETRSDTRRRHDQISPSVFISLIQEITGGVSRTSCL